MSEIRFSPGSGRAGQPQWRPWNRRSFREARRKDRPVLLSITASWSHRCLRMDETTYADCDIISCIDESFIPVRVDGDRRPDVCARYGARDWPTTAFLTPLGQLILSECTHLSPEEMKSLMQRVMQINREEAGDMLSGCAPSESFPDAARRHSFPPTDGEILSGNIPSNLRGRLRSTAGTIARSIAESHDPDFGGFASPPGYAPKHPRIAALDFLCTAAEKGDLDRQMLHVLRQTLDAMLEGEIFDSSRGGFFRLAAGRDWSNPNWEKLTSQNADLIETYLRAGRNLGVSRWTEAASRTLEYLNRHLTRAGGGFFPGLTSRPEFTGEEGEKPLGDDTLYTDVNARAASAHFLADRLLGNPSHLRTAVETLQAVEGLCSGGDVLYHYCDAGGERGPAFLRDYTELALANLDAHAGTGDLHYLDRALSLAETLRQYFALPDGSFSDRARGATSEVPAMQRAHVCPRDNARAALLCHKVSLVRNDPSWEQQGVAALVATASRAEAEGLEGATWAASHLEISRPAPHVRVLVHCRHEDAALIRSAREAPERHAVIEIDEGGVEQPLVYVCRQSQCFPPTRDPERVEALLDPAGVEIPESRH
ncbi:MAG: DUF255 domain-containing protein [Bacillota bacterium]